MKHRDYSEPIINHSEAFNTQTSFALDIGTETDKDERFNVEYPKRRFQEREISDNKSQVG
jgi:hypothetical protein